jgi:cytochrome c oxidase assembly protein subunit 15
MVQAASGLKGTGHFLAGIGGVVLLAAVVWKRHAPAPKPLPLLGWIAFVTVQLQGLLGGLRVVWLKDEIGVFHATLAQLFFLLICVIALFTTRRWSAFEPNRIAGANPLAVAAAAATILILAQLVIGATMRHQHAGLAIPDFPLAYGKLWPAMDAASIDLYNQTRLEVLAHNPITAFQVALQMVHRIVAAAILAAVAYCAWLGARNLGRGNPSTKLAFVWLGLILLQAILGAATIWTNKAADVATAHVVVGALSLAAGAFVCIVTFRQCEAGLLAQAGHASAGTKASPSGLRHPATGQRMRRPAT